MLDEASDSIRAFFALPLTAPMRGELARLVDQMRREDWAKAVRWVASENLHLTLRFLGDTPRQLLTDLEGCVREAVAELAGFEVRLRGIGLFPSHRRPRVVAAELADVDDLGMLARTLESAVVAHGLPAEDRPFRSHITLGRIRGRLAARPRLDHRLDGPSMWVGEVVLYRSVLRRTGAIYSELARIELGA